MGLVNILSSFPISVSGLSAQRKRLDTVAGNIANADASRTPGQGVRRRKIAVLTSTEGAGSMTGARKVGTLLQPARTHFRHLLGKALGARSAAGAPAGGVEVTRVVEDRSPLRKVYDPGHPEADESGYVTLPNIEVMTEMVDLMTATRAYEANVTALNAAKGMARKALEI